MANKYPLTLNSTNTQIQELQTVDELTVTSKVRFPAGGAICDANGNLVISLPSPAASTPTAYLQVSNGSGTTTLTAIGTNANINIVRSGSGNVQINGNNLVLASSFTTVGAGALTLTAGATATNVTLPATGNITLAYTGNNLSVFAATTSAQLAGVISDETGSGALVFATSPSLTTPNIGAATGTSLTATGTILSSGGAIGYTTGAGGAVTQVTSRATGVTLNELCGTITLFSTTTVANGSTSFVFTNSFITAADRLVLNHVSGGVLGAYSFACNTVNGSATISVYTAVAQATAAAPVIGFAVIRAVTA